MFGIAQSDRTHYSSGSLRKKCPLLAVESILNPDEDLDPKGTHYSLCPKTMKLYSVLCKLRVIQITVILSHTHKNSKNKNSYNIKCVSVREKAPLTQCQYSCKII